MHLRFVPAYGVNNIETRHIFQIDVSNRHAELTSARLLNSVMPRQSDRHTITAILKNYPESIRHAWFILNDEDTAFFSLFRVQTQTGTRKRYARRQCVYWALKIFRHRQPLGGLRLALVIATVPQSKSLHLPV